MGSGKTHRTNLAMPSGISGAVHALCPAQRRTRTSASFRRLRADEARH